jgi:predicted enzyme involved in methoxymalonyl-ACP biosynthesis
MRYSIESLDYLSLLKESRNVSLTEHSKRIRVAILADCATQHLIPILGALAARNDVIIDTYQGDYNGVELEILNQDSSLYLFDPQFVIILNSTEKLKTGLYNYGDRNSFAMEVVGKLDALWKAFRSHSNATIIQSTFVLPSERAFGNYELKVPDSVGSIIADINFRLVRQGASGKECADQRCRLSGSSSTVGKANILFHIDISL